MGLGDRKNRPASIVEDLAGMGEASAGETAKAAKLVEAPKATPKKKHQLNFKFKPRRKQEGDSILKNFRMPRDLAERLSKYAFEKETYEAEIVRCLLEDFLQKEGY